MKGGGDKKKATKNAIQKRENEKFHRGERKTQGGNKERGGKGTSGASVSIEGGVRQSKNRIGPEKIGGRKKHHAGA